MAYKLVHTQPPPRDPGLRWEQNGPGLHQDEVAVELDTGELVAVSVEVHWDEGNTGLGLHGWARLINGDGSSKTDPAGKVIETSLPTTVSQDLLERHGKKKLGREVMHAVLGEVLTQVRIAASTRPSDSDSVSPPAGTVLDPGASHTLLIAWSDEALRNANIRNAIAAMKVVGTGIDPAAALGLTP